MREIFLQLRFGDARLKLQPSDGKNALGLYYNKSAHTISQDISCERHSLGLSPMFLVSNRFQSIQTDQTIKSSRMWLGSMEWSTKQSWLRNCIVLGHHDDNMTAKASEKVQTVSDTTITTFGHEPADQGETISSPADQDQNHENVCVVGATKNQHVTEARDGSQDQDQNYTKNYGENGHPKRANEKQGSEFKRANEKHGKDIKRTNQKPMTYREALLGLDKSELGSEDNSESSSDF